MLISKNNTIQGKHKKPIVLDYGYKVNGSKKHIVILVHGFKGFKDWGHFNKLMEFFIKNDFAFVKFNFSHNGGTDEQPIDFPDLEAFGNNNYTKELDDLKTVIDWLVAAKNPEMNSNKLYLIGHSRGGGVSLLAANEDTRIKKLITWAAVSDLVNRYSTEVLLHWKKEGVIYIPNSRTNQQMPLYYQLAEDTLNNLDRFNIKNASSKISIPHLIIHGTADEVVLVKEAKDLKKWNKKAELFLIEGANHVFGAYHPYLDLEFPNNVKQVLKKTLEFIRR